MENIGEMRGHVGSVICLKFNYKGEYCMSGGSDKLIKLWNPFKNKMIQEYKGHGYDILDLEIVKDNSSFISCSLDKKIMIWNVETSKIIKTYHQHLDRVNSIQLNENDSILISGSNDKTAMIYDLKSKGNKPIQILNDSKDSITSIQLSKNEIILSSLDENIYIYDIRNSKKYIDFIQESISKIHLSNDFKLLAISTLNSKIKLMDKEKGNILNEFHGHINNKYKIDLFLYKDDIYTGSEDGNIYIYNIFNQKNQKIKSHSQGIISLDIKNNYLISGSIDSYIKLWKLK